MSFIKHEHFILDPNNELWTLPNSYGEAQAVAILGERDYYFNLYHTDLNDKKINVIDETMHVVEQTGIPIETVMLVLLDDVKGHRKDEFFQTNYSNWIKLLDLIK